MSEQKILTEEQLLEMAQNDSLGDYEPPKLYDDGTTVTLTVQDCTLQSSSKGSVYWLLRLSEDGDTEHADVLHALFIPNENQDVEKRAMTQRMLFESFKRFDIDPKQPKHPEMFIGKTVNVLLVVDEYEGTETNKIKKFLK